MVVRFIRMHLLQLYELPAWHSGLSCTPSLILLSTD
jgi:hypothetical protein